MRKNTRANSLPLVVIWFRPLLPNGALGSTLVKGEIGISELGLAQIGTVWSEGASNRELSSFDRQTFEVDFSKKGWRHESQASTWNDSNAEFIPQSAYRLRYGKADRSEILVFTLGDGRELLVPALEYFSRCYGHSGEVKRVLSTYGWADAKARLCGPAPEAVPRGSWGVRLMARCQDADGIFLAHVENDPHTERVARSVYSDLHTQFTNKKSGELAFPKIQPWHEGRGKLKVDGIWLDEDKRRFLGLRIVGCSEPSGPPILVWRSNPGPAEVPAGDDAPLAGWRGRRLPEDGSASSLAKLTSVEEPDRDSASIHIEAPSVEVLGLRRQVTQQRAKSAQTRPGPPVESTGADRFSAGERYGSSRGAGHASIHTEPALPSEGAQRDLWNALLYLHEQAPAVVQAVGWYSAQQREVIYSVREPKMISFPQASPDPDCPFNPAAVRWTFIDPITRAIRGALVCCVQTPLGLVYLIEAERKPKGGSGRGVAKSEETYCGMVIKPSPNLHPKHWLSRVMYGISEAEGVMKKAVAYCPPGKHDYYRRSRSTQDRVAGHSTALLALSKVGIDVPLDGLAADSIDS